MKYKIFSGKFESGSNIDGHSSPHSIHCNICSSEISTDLSNPLQIHEMRSEYPQQVSAGRYTFHGSCRTLGCRLE